MQLVIDDRKIPVNFQPGEPLRSEHTRRTLRTGTISFQVGNDGLQTAVDDALANAQNGQALTLLDDKGISAAFKVRSSSNSSSGWQAPWRYTVDLIEAENLKPESLEVDGIELRPYQYEERIEGEGIAITCKAEVDPKTGGALVAKLKEHQWQRTYFPVIRRGVEETARSMRFGQCAWSEHGASLKYEVVLVEDVADKAMTKFPVLLPEVSNVVHQAARSASVLDSLAEAMVAKGLLTEEDLSTIRDRAGAEEWDRAWKLYRVRDVDG